MTSQENDRKILISPADDVLNKAKALSKMIFTLHFYEWDDFGLTKEAT